MKTLHSIFFASMLTFSISTSAQITITASDLPQGGDSYTIQTSLPDPLSDFTTTGVGFDWDFSNLISDSEAEVAFVAMGEAPLIAQGFFNLGWLYPDYVCDFFGPGDIDLASLETLGIELPVAISNLYSYLQMSNDSYNIAGISMNVEGVDLPVQYSDIDEVHPLPLNYMDEINSTSAFTVNIPEVISYETSASRAGSVDGWGTLTLPGGATHEVLRVNTTITTHDVFSLSGSEPFEIDRVSNVYSWVGDGGMPYLEVSVIFGTVFSIEHQGESTVVDTSGNGITSAIPNAFIPFPNPISASADIILSGATIDTEWELRDATGRVINTGFGKTISTNGLASGAYLVSDITFLNKGLRSSPSTVIIK
jgi:hypothetical protein